MKHLAYTILSLCLIVTLILPVTPPAAAFETDHSSPSLVQQLSSIADSLQAMLASLLSPVGRVLGSQSSYPALQPTEGSTDPSLAVGLDGFSYWKSPPFLNLMKQGGIPGIRNSSGDYVPLEDLLDQGYLDANGYPVKMYPGNDLIPGWQQGYDITVSIHHQNDFVRQETSGDYVVEWFGAGDIQLRKFDVTSQQTFYASDGTVTGGRMTGTWGYENSLKTVKILDTDPEGTGNYIRDISIVRAEYKDMYDVGAIFDPRYTALIEDHHTLRFMDWMKTNGSDVKSLADVASMDSLTWAGGVNAGSAPEVDSAGVLPLPAQVPFEVMVQLANEVGADPWFNIPLKADDGYVRALAAYVDENLDDGLVAKFELSNEVWNWAGGFEQVREASLLGSGGETSTNIRAAREYYGYRSAEISAILDEEMSRVDAEMVLGTQTVYYEIAKWVEGGVSRYFTEQGISGQMSDVFDALAVTGYFSEVNRDELTELRQFWYVESEAEFLAGNTATKYDVFITRAADYLANGINVLTPEERALVATQVDGSFRADLLDPLEGKLRTNFAENKRMADQWGLELIQYEADSHISPKNYRGDAESEWYKALNKSPEMGQLTTRMAEIFREEGGTLVNDFGHLGDTDYGLWGTRAHMADENPISEAYDTYNQTAASRFGSINVNRDLSAFQRGRIVNGTDQADTLVGTVKRDYLIGGAGDDIFYPGPGDDGVHGGEGDDTVLFKGDRDQYTITTEGPGTRVIGPDGSDYLRAVEVLQFADESVRIAGTDEDVTPEPDSEPTPEPTRTSGRVPTSDTLEKIRTRTVMKSGADIRNKQHTLRLSRDTSELKTLVSRRERDLQEDNRFRFPLGLYEFTAEVEPGSTETITIELDTTYDTTNWTYRKYTGSEYIDISDRVTYGTTQVNGETVTTVSYDVTDNGPLDLDDRLGFITDPAGPAVEEVEGESEAEEETTTSSSSGGSSSSGSSSGGSARSSSADVDEDEDVPTQIGGTSGSSYTPRAQTTQRTQTSLPATALFQKNISFIQPQFNEMVDVRNLEQFLNDFEGESLPLDGVYGSEDNEAMKRFQRKYSREILDVWDLDEATGYVGITTRLKMNFLLQGQAAQCPAFTEYNGGLSGIMNSPEIGKTQVILRDLDMYTGPINNTWDATTNQALITFQETFKEVMLDPWNITEGTGYKYKTTNKFLNYFAGCDTGSVFLEGVGEYEGI